ncbi:MAG: SDR family oxidoreductase [Labilithrix sp.]|nr:SDR family oxidoreductase [Labilithrix sp.]
MGEEFDGRVVVVTGASAGVGRAVVRAFARRGANIALIARGIDGLEGARAEVEAMRGRALVLPLDVADADAVEEAADRVERELGPIDVWVNDAMVSVFAPVGETTPAEFKRVTEVTYLGYVHGTLAALKRMRSRDRGTIIQVGSALAYRAIPLQAAYCAAKHAVKGFTEALRTELRHDGSRVRVTQVHLPAVNTPQFSWSRAKLPRAPRPVPPVFQPEIAADAVLFAAAHDRREVWVAWPTTKAIAGERIAPSVADRWLAKHGYEAQQTREPLPAGRPDNLYAPVRGDHGAHGRFDAPAKSRSLQWSLTKRRRWIVASALAVVGLFLGGRGWRALAGAR